MIWSIHTHEMTHLKAECRSDDYSLFAGLFITDSPCFCSSEQSRGRTEYVTFSRSICFTYKNDCQCWRSISSVLNALSSTWIISCASIFAYWLSRPWCVRAVHHRSTTNYWIQQQMREVMCRRLRPNRIFGHAQLNVRDVMRHHIEDHHMIHCMCNNRDLDSHFGWLSSNLLTFSATCVVRSRRHQSRAPTEKKWMPWWKNVWTLINQVSASQNAWFFCRIFSLENCYLEIIDDKGPEKMGRAVECAAKKRNMVIFFYDVFSLDWI